jgi:small multidrug resistance family-3 protein
VTANLAIFAAAAVFEIAGCYAFWTWSRGGRSPALVLLGIASLVCFALALTRVDAPFAGRAYAAYGGIYIAASLAGALIILGFASRAS